MGKMFLVGNVLENRRSHGGSTRGSSGPSTIRSVGAHRWWGSGGLSCIRGVQWGCNPRAGVQRGDTHAHILMEEEKQNSMPVVYEEE